jgi:hypothetical protein
LTFAKNTATVGGIMAKQKPKQLTKVIATCQPPDWWAAWRKAANQAGMSLASWIGVQCNLALPESVRRKLSKRRKAGGTGEEYWEETAPKKSE